MSLFLIPLAALVLSFVISFALTPLVKKFAQLVGAMDVPKDGRRMHKVPIPRLGGLAIFLGFLLTVLLLVDLTPQLQSILLGSVIIVVLGVIDDIQPLRAWLKLIVQIIAALIPACSGVVVHILSNPVFFTENNYIQLGVLAIPITVIWIVLITNAVNLIDGLDGLAAGVSVIASLSVIVVALVLGDGITAVIMAALAGGCVGFIPYNFNPAKIFMGDTGATFLGYIMATVSVMGLFKSYAIISFVVPFLILGLPIFDTCFAFCRRLAHGKNPMAPDRSHVHHRLIDMGLNQKQAVAILYVVSVILGLSAVVLATSGALKAIIVLCAICAALLVASQIFRHSHIMQMSQGEKTNTPEEETPETKETPEPPAEESPAETPEAPPEEAPQDPEGEA